MAFYWPTIITLFVLFLPNTTDKCSFRRSKRSKKFQSPNVLVPFGGPLMAVSCKCILAWSLKKPNTNELNFEGATRIRRSANLPNNRSPIAWALTIEMTQGASSL